MITITVKGRRATASDLVPLPTGNVQSIKVQVQMPENDALWQNALIVAVFAAKTPKGSWIVSPGVIDENGQTKIPGDVLRVAESDVYVGIRGTYADNREITTNIAGIGKTFMGAGGELVDTQIRDEELTEATEFLSALYKLVESKTHAHQNISVLDDISAEDGNLLFKGKHVGIEVLSGYKGHGGEENRIVFDKSGGVFWLDLGEGHGWRAITHTHENAAALEKLQIAQHFSDLPANAPEGCFGVVTDVDQTTKSVADYDAQTDADAVLRFADTLTYDATAQIDGAMLRVDASSDDVSVIQIPVYTRGEIADTSGHPVVADGLDLYFVTDAADPKKYMIAIGGDTFDYSSLFADTGMSVADNAVVELALPIYVFEGIDVVIPIDDDEDDVPEDEVVFSFSSGYNLLYIIADDGNGNELFGVEPIVHINDYFDLGKFDSIRHDSPSAITHRFLYDVFRLITSVDKKGLYYRASGQWVPYYTFKMDALENRLSVLEDGVPDDVSMLCLGETYSDLVVRDEAVIGESIQDVPIYVHGAEGVICSLYTYTANPPSGKDYYDGVELCEVRQGDTGMPLRVLAVTVDGVRYSYFPSDYRNVSGEAIVSAGWNVSDQPTDAPTITNFTPNRFRFGGQSYEYLSVLSDAAVSALRSLSQCVNVSASAMGTIRVQDDAVLRFAGSFEPNRKYMFITSDDCTFTLPDIGWSAQDSQILLYYKCTANVDFAFASTVLFAGGTTPNSDTGNHKLIGCHIDDTYYTWAVGGIDYGAVT